MAMMVTTDKAATTTTAATAANCDEERHSAASSSGSDLQPPRLIVDLNSDDLPSAEAPDGATADERVADGHHCPKNASGSDTTVQAAGVCDRLKTCRAWLERAVSGIEAVRGGGHSWSKAKESLHVQAH